MNAPLSLFLTQFATPAPIAIPEPRRAEPRLDIQSEKPGLWLSISELEAQLDSAAQKARDDADRKHRSEIAKLATAHEMAIAEALASAREAWVEAESARFDATLTEAMDKLWTGISDKVANVLRPLLATALLARVRQDLLDALDRLLADPSQPALSVRAPEDLGAALRAARPGAGIEWIVGESVEVTILANGARIETKLASALADIVLTEA